MVSAALTMRRSVAPFMTCCLAVLAAGPVHALNIRSYSAARHDRFTGFPSAPVLNAGSWFNGGLYTGVGWSVAEPNRQFALVSPRHFVLASHWGISPGETIRFLGADGQTHAFTVASTTQITDSGGGTDLTLGRLVETVPLAAGVSPLPFLHFNGDNQYRNKALQVFGFTGRVGASVSADFLPSNYSGNTRMIYFGYSVASGGMDDCHFAVGDSGSPSFVVENNKPALIGVHSLLLIDSEANPTTYYSADTFVPHYVPQLNALMAADGWQMAPSDAAANTLTRSVGTTDPATLRQANAGSATFTVQNAANAANNLRVSLTFPSGQGPASFTADGWYADQTGPQTWSFHKPTQAANSSATLTANWTSLPAVASLPVQVATRSDGSDTATTTFTLSLNPSFAAWGAGLASAAPTDDPDGDGLNNAQEYAFGGDPQSGGSLNASGLAAKPVLVAADSGHVQLRYPVRTDASARGLWYKPEYSQTLANDWTETSPAGTTVSYAAYSPAVAGFTEALVTVPVVAGRQFVRVKVLLDESAPGMTVP
jgi:hypothetical protein